jgi:hypothetical protein
VSAKLSDSLDQIKQNIALLTNNFGSSICLWTRPFVHLLLG